MSDPDTLFRWPLARVLAVFYLDAARPKVEEFPLNTPGDWAKLAAELKRRKGK